MPDEDATFFLLLASGRYPGVGLHEMRTQWTLRDLANARDLVIWLNENDRLAHEHARAEARRK